MKCACPALLRGQANEVPRKPLERSISPGPYNSKVGAMCPEPRLQTGTAPWQIL